MDYIFLGTKHDIFCQKNNRKKRPIFSGRRKSGRGKRMNFIRLSILPGINYTTIRRGEERKDSTDLY